VSFSLEQIVIFEAVSRLGSFTAAAREVFRAKSAVSHSIKALEESLGLKLLERSTRHVELTPEGELILAKARELLTSSRALSQMVYELSVGQEASLTLLIDGAAPVASIMKAVQRLTAAPISTRVKVAVEHLHKVVERFEREQADMMVTFGFKHTEGFATLELPPIESLLVAHQSHPLAQSEAPLTRAALSEHIELLVAGAAQDPISAHYDLHLGSAHLFEVSDFSLKRQAILEGVGYGWLPRHLIEADLKEGRLCVLPLAESASRWLLPQLVYRLDPPLGQVGRTLLAYLEEEARALVERS